MWLRILVLVAAIVYVGYRVTLSLRIVRAVRRGDAERERALRRVAFRSSWAAIGILVLAGLLLVGLVALNSR
jgi:hypothetical protein